MLCAGFMMIILDSTIVNVALPSIQADLGFSQASLAWVVNAYLIAFGGLLLLSGRLGDLIGRRRVFLGGLALFTVASLLCGFASSQALLIGARFAQGIGGALTSAVILGMIVTMFPEPREQAKAIGIYSFVASAGASIGLLAGGVLTQAISWHWIFFVNVPIGVATALLALRYVADDKGIGLAKGADVLGALLVTGAVMVGVYTVLEVGDHGWTSVHTLGFGAAALALLAAFIVREGRAATPLIPLRVFRSRNLSGASLTIVLMVAGMFGMFFLGVLYLQRILGYDAIEIGLAFLPVSLLIGALSLGVSARLNLRFGARATLVPGLVAGGGGARVLLARTGRRPLRVRRPAGRRPARRRRRARVPVADDDLDVGRPARRRGPGLRRGQHEHAGRRGLRPRRPRDAGDRPDRGTALAGRPARVGAHRRLPARVPRRGRPDRCRAPARDGRAPLGAARPGAGARAPPRSRGRGVPGAGASVSVRGRRGCPRGHPQWCEREGARIMSTMNSTPSPTPLTRSSTDRKIAGVAGGLARQLGIDPTIVRVGFAVSILFSGVGIVAYLVMLALVPSDDAMPAATSPTAA